MADSKVSDLTAATSVNSADVLYLIQASTDKKLSISTLLANLPATLAKFSGIVALGGTYQTITNAGAINATMTTTYFSNTQDSVLTIANGTYEGQLKVLIFTNGAHESAINSNIGASSLSFSQSGETAILMWSVSQTKWYIVGGSATITY